MSAEEKLIEHHCREATSWKRVRGRDLKVGDTIQVWWAPRRDIITKLIPYHGPLAYLWDKDGGARLASFALLKTGMTIEPVQWYEVLNRGEA